MRVRNPLAFGVLLLLGYATAAAAQPPAGAGGQAAENAETLVLLRNAGVQAELGLDPAQRERIGKLPEEDRAKHKKQLDDLRQLAAEVKAKPAKLQLDPRTTVGASWAFSTARASAESSKWPVSSSVAIARTFLPATSETSLVGWRGVASPPLTEPETTILSPSRAMRSIVTCS